MTEQKILIIVHQEHSTPGRVGVKLRQRGYALDIRRPCLGHPLPQRLDAYAGAVMFGGPMSANDDGELPFIGEELRWLEQPLAQGLPFLGICLGAQMLARHLGARVFEHPHGRAEIGYYPIETTAAAQRLARWPDHVYQWHREGFELPHGGELLAFGKGDFDAQAFSYGERAFAIQFHPEVTLAMMHRWTIKAAHRFVLPGVRPRETHFVDRLAHDRAVDAWLDQFLDHWLGLKAHTGDRLAAEPVIA